MQNDTIHIAINGFGRIGRAFFKQALEEERVKIVAVNDLGDIENLAYLLRHDSVYGKYGKAVQVLSEDGKTYLKVGEQKITFLSVRSGATTVERARS